MPAPDAALAYDLRQRALSAATSRAMDRLWARVTPSADFGAAWDSAAAFRLLTVAQRAAAVDAETYLRDVLPAVDLPDEPVGAVDPAAFAGIASDGRDLASLLDEPVIRAREAGGGVQGLEAGRSQLRLIVSTQLADAGREAVQVGIVARPRVTGYVRMLQPPSCPRCAILAGRWYRWGAGFKRHPGCDCRHIPAAEDRADDFRTDPRQAIEQGAVKGLTRAQAKAIADGADPSQVVNADRGVSTATIGGQRVRITAEGTTRRGYASYVRRAVDRQRGAATPETVTRTGRRGAVANYSVRRTRPRLMPSEIYRQAGDDRAEAIRLLTTNGYVVPSGNQTIRGLAATVA